MPNKQLVILGTTLLLLSGCLLPQTAQFDAAQHADLSLSILQQTDLPPALDESSGLDCNAGALYSINDSGNAPVIYQLDETGNVVQPLTLAVPNHDWEAITFYNDRFYVADIGNNFGQRPNLAIVEASSLATDDITTRNIAIRYSDNRPTQNVPYDHDFDGEALTVANGQMVLFSKSWQSRLTRVYQFPVPVDKQTLELTAQTAITGLPGIVTGADYDPKRNEFVLVGYQPSAIGQLRPFIAVLDKSFSVLSVNALNGFRQVEAVCVIADTNSAQADNARHYFITQEGSGSRPAKLVKLRLQ